MKSRFFEFRPLALFSGLLLLGCLEGDPNPYQQVLGSGGSDSSPPPLRSGVTPGSPIFPGTECATDNSIPVSLSFSNASIDDLLVYWVDYSCVENAAGTLLRGGNGIFNSYAGHPWRFRRLSTNELLFEYLATESETQNVKLP